VIELLHAKLNSQEVDGLTEAKTILDQKISR
jgi:hypothetical protein